MKSRSGSLKANRYEAESLSSLSTLPSSNELDVNLELPSSLLYARSDDASAREYFKACSERWFPRRRDLFPTTSQRQWSQNHTKYDIVEKLGSGTYGTVYKVRSKADPSVLVAMKVSKLDQSGDEGLSETAVREAVLLYELQRHPNIINMSRLSCDKSKKLYLFCDLLEMDLRGYLHEHRQKRLPFETIKHLSTNIIRGLAQCHDEGIVHRDLKPVGFYFRSAE